MHILFFTRSVSQFRPYRSIIRALSARGHTVRAVFDPRYERRSSFDSVRRFQEGTPGFSYTFGCRRGGAWKKIIFAARELRSYRRYLLAPRQAAFYRERWVNFLPLPLRTFVRAFPRASTALIKSRWFNAALLLVEKITPSLGGIVDMIRNEKPDVVVVGYRNLPSRALDLEYLKAAKALHIPSVIPVLGWDTLTTKGLIQIVPDRMLVWNEDQVAELAEHHDIAGSCVRVVGAYQFDFWLARTTPSLNRAEFCARWNLRPEDPLLLYFGFSYSGKDRRLRDGHGPSVVEGLRRALDASGDARLARAQILVRPHPMHTDAFRNMNVRDATVMLMENTLMSAPEDVELLYDTVYHSLCAAAINTTAIIDAVIQDKPGIILNWDEYKTVQGGTHFKQFMATGAVLISHSSEEFSKLVRSLVDGNDLSGADRRAFFNNFIRPRGATRSAGEVAADEIETLVHSYEKKK
ncbi:MAG: hypothetical protein Q8R17_01455 [bacterium]|nr:hypothetical protein [bacterium]